MPIRIHNLRRPVEEPEELLTTAIARKLHLPPQEIAGYRILRKSLDARSRFDLRFVYSVAVDLNDPAARSRMADDRDIDDFQTESFDDPTPGTQQLSHPPVVVGSGPAGLLAGYYLALKGYRPLIIERG
ncbi:MAG: NAD(P)-binding protein, partial [Planctomycetaceae bacterium]|nr:NAD(P)-binding protein [Planctomycetaceae bacterium]